MRESIFNGLKFGVAGLLVAALMLFGLNALDVSRETIVGILGGVCSLLSIVVFLFGALMWVARKIPFSDFVKTFFPMSVILGMIGSWNLINAGWLG